MFKDKYREACEDMKLSESFKSGLVNMMKNNTKRAIPKSRLVLATVIGVILVSSTVVFATNYATHGQLLKNMFGGAGNQQPTETSLPLATEATPTPTTEPTATPTEQPTTAPTDTPTAAPTAVPTATPTPKPTQDPNARVAPVVKVTAGTNSVTVTWNKIASPDLVGYKVVASKSDSTPMYSENGYYTWITDCNTTSCVIKNGACYNGGDVGKFSGGTPYYFSVTAIYGDEWQKIAGNAVLVTMPGVPVPTPDPSSRVAPVVSAVAGANDITVTWNQITSPDLVGYKVVASKSDSTPMYSENGYYAWITDANVTSCTITNGDCYNDGDVGKFSGGTAYYFSVTAIYGDEWQKVAGNTIQLTMPGAAAPIGTYPAVTGLTVTPEGAGLRVSWTKTTDATNFTYYKVVASINTASPAYPGNGWYKYFTNPDETSCYIPNIDPYNSGDFVSFASGQAYHFSITAVYCDGNTFVPGTPVDATMP